MWVWCHTYSHTAPVWFTVPMVAPSFIQYSPSHACVNEFTERYTHNSTVKISGYGPLLFQYHFYLHPGPHTCTPLHALMHHCVPSPSLLPPCASSPSYTLACPCPCMHTLAHAIPSTQLRLNFVIRQHCAVDK